MSLSSSDIFFVGQLPLESFNQAELAAMTDVEFGIRIGTKIIKIQEDGKTQSKEDKNHNKVIQELKDKIASEQLTQRTCPNSEDT